MFKIYGTDKLGEWLGITHLEEYNQGFFWGMMFILVLFILMGFMKWQAKRRRKFKGVTVPGTSGNLYITKNAVQQFVHRIMNEFDEASLVSMSVQEVKKQIVFKIDLKTVPGADLVPLRDQLQKRILEDAENRLGISMPIKVHIYTESVEARPKKGKRKVGLRDPEQSVIEGKEEKKAKAEEKEEKKEESFKEPEYPEIENKQEKEEKEDNVRVLEYPKLNEEEEQEDTDTKNIE